MRRNIPLNPIVSNPDHNIQDDEQAQACLGRKPQVRIGTKKIEPATAGDSLNRVWTVARFTGSTLYFCDLILGFAPQAYACACFAG